MPAIKAAGLEELSARVRLVVRQSVILKAGVVGHKNAAVINRDRGNFTSGAAR